MSKVDPSLSVPTTTEPLCAVSEGDVNYEHTNRTEREQTQHGRAVNAPPQRAQRQVLAPLHMTSNDLTQSEAEAIYAEYGKRYADDFGTCLHK